MKKLFSLLLILSTLQLASALTLTERISLKTYCTLTTFPFFWIESGRCKEKKLVDIQAVKENVINNTEARDLQEKYSLLANKINTTTVSSSTNTITLQPQYITVNKYISTPGTQGPRGEQGQRGESGDAGPNGVNTNSPITSNSPPFSAGGGSYQYVPVSGPQGPAGLNGTTAIIYSGDTASTTNYIATSTNTLKTIVNGISSLVTNIINSLTTTLSGNILTTNINGVVATSSVIGNNNLSFSTTTNILTSNINGILSTTSLSLDQNILKYYAESTSSTFLTSPVASGLASVAIGDGAVASGYASYAIGIGNFALADASSAFGRNNQAGQDATAFGSGNQASFDSSAFGNGNNAVGEAVVAFGIDNTVFPQRSSAFGIGNTVNAGNAFGILNTVNGGSAFGEGNITTGGSAFGDNNTILYTESNIYGTSIFGFGITNNISGSTQIGPSDTAKITILASGNLGVGTVDPSEKLEVNGNIKGDRFIGYGAGNINNNSAVGLNSLLSNTSGENNTANGANSLASNTTGYQNTANGVNSLFSNTTGNSNTASGLISLSFNTIGNNNTANGTQSLFSNTSGNQNTASGVGSLLANLTGDNNTANGTASLYSNSSGDRNTASGYQSLFGNTTGSNNTAIGFNAMYFGGTGSNNTAIGANADIPNANLSNQIRLGNSSVTYFGSQVALTVTSDSRYKENIVNSPLGLSFLNTLRPVQYERINDISNRAEFGFIAQELESSLLSSSSTNSGIISTDSNGYKSVRYNDLFSPIVKGIQELDAKLNLLSSATNSTSTQFSSTTLQSLLSLASTTNLISGNIFYTTNLDLNNYSLFNVKSISSASGNWSISEDGTIRVKVLSADYVELLDTDGSKYCYRSVSGNFVKLGIAPCAQYNPVTTNNGGTNSNGTTTSTSTSTTNSGTTTSATSSPAITILNDNSASNTYVLGSVYVEHGATSTDYDGSEITNLITVDNTEVNINATGTYNVTYTVISSTTTLQSVANRAVTVIE